VNPEPKRLPDNLPNKKLFGLGFYAGLGFWTSAIIFFMVVIPGLACAALVILSAFGSYFADIMH